MSGQLLRHGWRKTVFPHDGLEAEVGLGDGRWRVRLSLGGARLVQPPDAIMVRLDHDGSRVETLNDALARHGKLDILNTNRRSQFTSASFTGVLASHVTASMSYVRRPIVLMTSDVDKKHASTAFNFQVARHTATNSEVIAMSPRIRSRVMCAEMA
ncbi:hypothetical protein XH80_24085 [Bradyrhizobium sp. CCBAU 45384]|nr:hypothetical protein [Bradyrhizobium sp. CCBAU 45384]